MIVSKITADNDWNFGRSLSNYISGNEAIIQNVKTRLQSFKYDWFLDSQAHIDWFNILSRKNTEKTILQNVEVVTRGTDGVTKVNSITKTLSNRKLIIVINFSTIYTAENTTKVTI